MLASTSSVVVLGSLFTLASAAPTRSPIFSLGRGLAKRTSASDIETFASQVEYPVACAAQCKAISVTLDGCYDQDSCAPACASGQYDTLVDCYNCVLGVENAADYQTANVTEAQGNLDLQLGEYLEMCTALHYAPLNQTDNSVAIVTATPTGTAEPEYATLNVTATQLKTDATVTITPLPFPGFPTASAAASTTA